MPVIRRRLLGVLALLAFAGLVVVLWQRPDPFAHNLIVRADVTDASGLAAIGADVRVAGVPVGKVAGVTRDGNLARLTLTLDSSVGTVHRDARLALRPRLMFEGTAYVELSPGSPGAPSLGQRVIPSTHTSTYVPFADVLSVLRAHTRRDVRTIAASGATLLSRQAPSQLHDVIGAAPGLLSDVALDARAARGPHGTELRAAVASLGRVAAAAASQSPSLSSGVGDAASTFAALETRAGQPLQRSLQALPAVSSNLAAGASAASEILARAQALIPQLQPGVEQLTPTIGSVRPLLRQALPVLAQFTPVLTDVQAALNGASDGARPALSAIRALEPTLNIFQGTLLTALEQRTDLGDPAYLAFLGLFAGGGGASRSFGVDGQGHFMRFGLRFLTGVGQPLPPCALLTKVSPLLSQLLQSQGACTQ